MGTARRDIGRGQRAGEQFPETSWTLLTAACESGTAGRAALKELMRMYYTPVYAYLRAILGKSGENVDDLTNSFIQTRLLSRRLLKGAKRDKGRFRHYLKQALRNYVIDWQRRQKRELQHMVSIDDEKKPDLIAEDPWPQVEAAFHLAWVRALLQRALGVVQDICLERGQQAHLEIFLRRYLSEPGEEPSWKELGAKLNLDEKKARHRAETVVRHFRSVVRQILIEETGSEQAATEEIETLFALL